MSNQDIEGDAPGGTEPTAPAGTPEYFEQQLAKERDARALMRERLRNTEALAAESHALRARMAQELERVTADRDRLRNAAETAAAAGSTPPAAAPAPTASVAPPMTPRASDRPLKPPIPQRRKAPWLALTLLAGLAVGVAGLAWVTGSMPGEAGLATVLAPAGTPPEAASAPVVAAATPATLPAASTALASTAQAPAPAPSGPVALPPLTPEAQLAAAPTAAGNTPTAAGNAPTALPATLPGRLRAALDAEGIVAPVDIDAATGRVAVSDPAADNALRDRTDMIIRAAYAGASLPEPQIEHRWLSPPHAGRVASAALPVPDATAPVAVAKTPVRTAEHPARVDVVADAQEVRPILPAGRVTESCKAGATARSGAHRATEVAACMKHSCCSAAYRQTEECRAYVRAYPLTCSAG